MSVRHLIGGGVVSSDAAHNLASLAVFERRRPGNNDGSNQDEPLTLPMRMVLTKAGDVTLLKIWKWMLSGTSIDDYTVTITPPDAEGKQDLIIELNNAGPFFDSDVLVESHRAPYTDDSGKQGEDAVLDNSNGRRDVEATLNRTHENKFVSLVSLPPGIKFKTALRVFNTKNIKGNVSLDNPDIFHVYHRDIINDDVAADDIDHMQQIGTYVSLFSLSLSLILGTTSHTSCVFLHLPFFFQLRMSPRHVPCSGRGRRISHPRQGSLQEILRSQGRLYEIFGA